MKPCESGDGSMGVSHNRLKHQGIKPSGQSKCRLLALGRRLPRWLTTVLSPPTNANIPAEGAGSLAVQGVACGDMPDGFASESG
jgi:hypothetical protein